MVLEQKIAILDALGKKLSSMDLSSVVESASQKNPWFTKENINTSLLSIVRSYLQSNKLEKWINRYSFENLKVPKKIGLVLAGNIPLVGFHDILCVFITNNIALLKYSDKDDVLIPFLLDLLSELDPSTKPYFQRVDRLTEYDAVIATGSNNTAKHFAYYFKHVPHIIRKNRNGIAILDGTETNEERIGLSEDIFSYFGLGCRNISKIFIPEGFDFDPLFTSFDGWKHLACHHKYKNNLEYNHALFLLNKQPFLQHEAILLVESGDIASRVGCLHYEYYSEPAALVKPILERQDEIQCLVGHINLLPYIEIIPFGEAQNPNIDTYADGVDTLQFLLNINST